MKSISATERTALEADTDRLAALLTELGRLQPLRDPIAAAMEENCFTPPQVHALLWLRTETVLTMGELARRIGITEKTVTGIVDRLEKTGQVSRVRDEEDRRVVRVRLTRAGTVSAKKMEKLVREKMMLILAFLDQGDRQALFRIFEKLITGVQAARSVAASYEAHQ